MLVVTKEHLLYFWTSKLRFLDHADVIFTQLHNSSSAIFVSLFLFAFCFFSENKLILLAMSLHPAVT